ncbi:MAG: HDOD domain-containing protein [Deltaproteobacteria bacterium]|nr:HDOD domain-containing protein [Deltaproteobacteria bacterium]
MDPINRTNTARTIIKKFNKMKTIPSVANTLIKMTQDDKSTLEEFEKVIKMDPVMVLRLLKLVNSSYFSLQTKIKNISEAVAYIGMDNLRNLLVLDVLKNIFSQKTISENFSRSYLWLHSSVASVCSQMVAERIFTQKGEDAFLCGLLHDIGIIVEEQSTPKMFSDFCSNFNPAKDVLTDYEYLVMGTDHPTIGSLFIEEWGLNMDICKAIKVHHKPLNKVEPNSLEGILQISEYLISRLQYNAFPEMNVILNSNSLLVHMKNNLTEYKAIVDDLPYEIQKAKELYTLEEYQNG